MLSGKSIEQKMKEELLSSWIDEIIKSGESNRKFPVKSIFSQGDLQELEDLCAIAKMLRRGE